MAVEFDAATESAFAAQPHTFLHTCTGDNRLLIVTIAEWLGTSTSLVTAITYDGVSLTKLDQAFNTALPSIWYLVNPSSGENTISITTTNTDGGAIAISFAGAHQSSTFGTVVKDEDTDATPAVVLTSAVGELCIDVLAILGTSTAVVSGGQDLRHDIVDGNAHNLTSTETGAASVTMSYTVTGDSRRAMMGVPIKAAPPSVFASRRLLVGHGQ